jgi:hypothetical protein
MDKDVGFTQRHANANDRNVANVWNYVDDRMGADDMNGANEGNEDNHVARRYDLPTIPILSAEQADVQVLGTFRVDCSRSLLPNSDALRRQLVLLLLQRIGYLRLIPLTVEEVRCSVLRLAAVSPSRSSLPRMS